MEQRPPGKTGMQVSVVSPLLRGWIVPVGDAIPDRREAALRGTHSQAALGNDRNKVGGLYFKFGAGVCQQYVLHFPSCARRRACILG